MLAPISRGSREVCVRAVDGVVVWLTGADIDGSADGFRGDQLAAGKAPPPGCFAVTRTGASRSHGVWSRHNHTPHVGLYSAATDGVKGGSTKGAAGADPATSAYRGLAVRVLFGGGWTAGGSDGHCQGEAGESGCRDAFRGAYVVRRGVIVDSLQGSRR